MRLRSGCTGLERQSCTPGSRGYPAPLYRAATELQPSSKPAAGTLLQFRPALVLAGRMDFGRAEALVTLELPAGFVGDLDRYPIHPALVDMATGSAMFLIADYEAQGGMYVPMNYGQVRIRKPVPAKCFSHIRANAGVTADNQVATFDVDIFDADGEVLIEIREFMLRQICEREDLTSTQNGLVQAASSRNAALSIQPTPAESISSVEGVAAFKEIMSGRYAENVVAFPSDFSAFFARTTITSHAFSKVSGTTQESTALRDDIERTLAQWFRELLGGEAITSESDFFRMGGQSLTAVRLFAKIKKMYGVQLSPAVIYESPSIEKLAKRLREATSVVSTGSAEIGKTSLIPIRPAGSKAPLFLFPDMNGTVIGFDSFVNCLRNEVPVYGLEAMATASAHAVPLRIEAMAARHVEGIRAVQPRGPYHLLGYSFGGLMAFEVAQQLTAAGDGVELLGMLDTWQLGHLRELDALQSRSEKIARRARKALVHAQHLICGPERLAYFEDHLFSRVRRAAISSIMRPLVAWSERAGRPLPNLVRDPANINWFAAQQYVVKPYSGKITMFRAARGIALDDPRYGNALGWQNIAAGGVEIHEVPGTHRDLLKQPNVQSLASEINSVYENPPMPVIHSLSPT